ncbi:hypothetical protein [Paraferrimonas sedimenticola]|uniref:Uncharacterized protein n=1 Tax=Paraferrimonas sedimenticola TaxID=375674 RepID=A0AA37W0D1_9GAMM|nr:hypothetical protein [Paraferrimonas sedimenticola]GLP94857.1 hypothetical protein GCM10007895_01630 [Paraferrimonas sedimenticola]
MRTLKALTFIILAVVFYALGMNGAGHLALALGLLFELSFWYQCCKTERPKD